MVASMSQLVPRLNDITFHFFNLLLFIYNFLAMLGLHCYESFSPVVASGDYSPVAAQASHSRGLSGCRAQTVEHVASAVEAMDSVVVA